MEYFKPHDKVTKVKLGDQVILRGRIVIVPTPESPKNDCLLRYGSGPLDCVWVSTDAPFYIDRPCHEYKAKLEVFEKAGESMARLLPTKEPETFTGLHDFITTGHRRFNKGDHVKLLDVGNGTFIKYYKGKKNVGNPEEVKCLFKPDVTPLIAKGSSKKGYFIVDESRLFLLNEEIK